MPRETQLYAQHVALGARLVEFHGWLLPVQYDAPAGVTAPTAAYGIIAEHRHCRTAASVFDTSHMGQFLIAGAHAAEDLGAVLTQDAAGLAVGGCRYGFLLNEAGGIVDDTILMRLAATEFLLVVNAGRTGEDGEWLKARCPRRTTVVDRSREWGKLDVQGPRSYAVLAPLVAGPPGQPGLSALRYYSVMRAQVAGTACIVSRTGYTGELGYELFVPGDKVVDVFRALLNNPLAHPAGLGARDALRLEMGYPLYGADIGVDTNPLEADLARFVALERRFVGAAALRACAAQGVARRLVVFQSAERRRPGAGNVILHNGQPGGAVTSAAFAPSLNVAIGLGYVRADLAQPGAALTVKAERSELAVTVAAKPLYAHGTCRIAVGAGIAPRLLWSAVAGRGR